MRERLTIAFVLLTVTLLLGAGVVRSLVLRDLIREQESAHLHQEVVLVAAMADDRLASGVAVNDEFLRSVVGEQARIEYDPPHGESVVGRGAEYAGSGDPADDMSASAAVGAGKLTISQSDDVIADIISRDLVPLLALFVLVALVAGVVGFVIASALSAPFQRLAVAAGNLGRGRFDLELPRTRIPEARAISTALRTSAHQLEERLQRERDFAEHASHVLKTPLTGLRLELEDLTLRDDVPPDVKEAATRSLAAVDEVSTVAGELVEISRQGALVAGSELPLADLATQIAQRWADRLAGHGRTFTAAAEGDITITYTPGPVEHVTDLLLADVVRRGSGAVRLVFQGEEGGQLRIRLTAAGRSKPRRDDGEPQDRIAQARSVVEALGGRVTGDHPADGVDVLLPRR